MIEVGEYVRTKDGYIYKLLGEQSYLDNQEETVDFVGDIIKHSKNIFDLIETGDILKIKEDNLVYYISWNEEYDISLEEIQKKAELLAIITKEQAKTTEYEVNESEK